MTEELKARRRETANKIRVKASPLRMPLNEFNDKFRGRQIINSDGQRAEIERITQEMFCDECYKPTEARTTDGPMEGTLLHVRIDDDPLRNYWKMATMQCHHCGFFEHVYLDRPQFDPADVSSGRNIAGSLLGGFSSSTGVVSAPDPYLMELSRQQEEAMKASAMAQQAMQMQQKQQAMAQKHQSALEQLQAMGGSHEDLIDAQKYMNQMAREMGLNLGGVMAQPPQRPKTATEIKMQQEHGLNMLDRMRRRMGL